MRHAVEPLPSALRVTERLPDRSAALAGAHFPDTEEDEAEARRRLAFEELFLAQVAVVGRRRSRRDARRAAPLESTGELVDPWLEGLPFEPTGDQRSAARANRRRPRPATADAATADGGGGLGQDDGVPWERCCGRWRTAARPR